MKIIGFGNISFKKTDNNNGVSFGTTLKGFPGVVEIGVNKVCNLIPKRKIEGAISHACPYCPNCMLKERPPEVVMPMPLFEKILRGLKAIDFDGIIHYHRFGEPLSPSVKVEEYILMTKKILKKVKTELFTNGVLLTRQRLESLRRTPLDRIIVTQQEPTKVGFMERLREIPDDLLGNVEVKYWDELNLINRAGVLRGLQEPLQTPCYSVHTNLAIDSDGIIPLCIDDYHRQIVVGDTNKETIEEIWKKPFFRKLREKLDNGRRSDIPICQNCDRAPENRASNANLKSNSALHRKYLLITTGSAHVKNI